MKVSATPVGSVRSASRGVQGVPGAPCKLRGNLVAFPSGPSFVHSLAPPGAGTPCSHSTAATNKAATNPPGDQPLA